ncbi:hypothetical protein [Arcanobacterium bovis]|uniref:Uncharacterized protein n=1 Tax=Arcanobacterium bovis TaxID=2529275 RepID=A0A4V2KR64_9ACTO|nr:hypothetical protein [Arcanobacterium bovis]TBW22749.1 hypothetical protein EZJ44_02220 [Arcanobacterium bovis]
MSAIKAHSVVNVSAQIAVPERSERSATANRQARATRTVQRAAGMSDQQSSRLKSRPQLSVVRSPQSHAVSAKGSALRTNASVEEHGVVRPDRPRSSGGAVVYAVPSPYSAAELSDEQGTWTEVLPHKQQAVRCAQVVRTYKAQRSAGPSSRRMRGVTSLDGVRLSGSTIGASSAGIQLKSRQETPVTGARTQFDAQSAVYGEQYLRIFALFVLFLGIFTAAIVGTGVINGSLFAQGEGHVSVSQVSVRGDTAHSNEMKLDL